jgi:hypothetical protein
MGGKGRPGRISRAVLDFHWRIWTLKIFVSNGVAFPLWYVAFIKVSPGCLAWNSNISRLPPPTVIVLSIIDLVFRLIMIITVII